MKNNFKKRKVFLFVAILLGMLIAAELSVRTLDYARGYPFWSNTHRNLVTKTMKPLIPYRIFGWPLYEDIDGKTYIVSVHGERYPLKKGDDAFRIVAFGEGNTKKIIDGMHFPLLLQQKLQTEYPQKHIEVINVGESKYATTHSLTLLAFDVISWNPDLVIIDHNGNDLLTGYWPNLAYDYSNKYGTAFYMPNYAERLTKTNILFNWSSFYWLVKEKLSARADTRALEQKNIIQRISYGSEPPQGAVEIFSRNLRAFLAITRANDIPVILGTQPLNQARERFEEHFRLKEYNKIVRYPAHEEFIAHFNLFNDTIKKIARTANAYAIDHNAILNGDPEYFSDYVHMNKRGLEKLADDYYRFIMVKNIITK
mgnify:CR=1 FL=1